MAAISSLTRYWVITIILLSLLYWSIRLSSRSIWLGPAISEAAERTQTHRNRPDVGSTLQEQTAEHVQASARKQYPIHFPRIIWQTAGEHGKEQYSDNADTWKDVQGFQYNFLSDEEADKFVHDTFAARPAIVRFWEDLRLPVLKADFLRYLTMLAVGGVYSDIDTSCLLHPDQWMPADLDASTVNAIIGIEYDDITYKMFVRPISFCQWTLMAKPGHPIFETAVQRAMSNLEFLARRRRVTIAELTPEKMEILEATGPGMISDVILQVLQDQGQNVTWESFKGQKDSKLFGDVLVLPINGFAGSQKHSHAGDPEYGQQYVAHHFGRSWYAPGRAGSRR